MGQEQGGRREVEEGSPSQSDSNLGAHSFAPVACFKAATPPMWSQCAWVIKISLTSNPSHGIEDRLPVTAGIDEKSPVFVCPSRCSS